MNGPTRSVYETALQKKGLQPETVPLKHGAQGHWIGNKNAKNVVIYYHGMLYLLSFVPFYCNTTARLKCIALHDDTMLQRRNPDT